MRTVTQILNLGERIFREWNKYQKQKERDNRATPRTESRQEQARSPRKDGNFGSFGRDYQAPSAPTSGGTNRPAPPSNPYATGYPTGFPGSQDSGATSGSWENGGYPGDFFGTVHFAYSPSLDGDADPGEVVWAWVPFEEDYTQGKDRPVLIIGHNGPYLLGLMLTSKDKNSFTSKDPNYLDIGAGVWDKEGRDSEVKLNRVVQLSPQGIRREGAIMDQGTFDFIAQAFNSR
ncbi:type II toxin-antitoxin system PemK/MazF family toxin [Rothia nasimurium]|uniref:type II toxin-antitoxin system PemK/MazF family toxin n=1 Tax=Rothia nasimurium TaxID=85336 RepID=UPI003B9ED9C9